MHCRHINEEKSLRAVSEHRIKSLQEDLDCMEKECADYKNQCMEYKSYSATLSEELSVSAPNRGNCLKNHRKTCSTQLLERRRQVEQHRSAGHILRAASAQVDQRKQPAEGGNRRLHHGNWEFEGVQVHSDPSSRGFEQKPGR